MTRAYGPALVRAELDSPSKALSKGTVRCGHPGCPWEVACRPQIWMRELLGHWAETHEKEGTT